MTVEQSVEYLLAHCKLFDKGVIRDQDRRGRDFCEMIIKNEKQPMLPITVSVTDDGASISVGQIEDVANSDRMTPEEVLSAIDDIINDRIIFVIAYREEDDIGFGAPYFSRVFAITGGNDDMSADYDSFVAKISTPIKKFLRPVTALKGRFLIFNYSGSLSKTLTR